MDTSDKNVTTPERAAEIDTLNTTSHSPPPPVTRDTQALPEDYRPRRRRRRNLSTIQIPDRTEVIARLSDALRRSDDRIAINAASELVELLSLKTPPPRSYLEPGDATDWERQRLDCLQARLKSDGTHSVVYTTWDLRFTFEARPAEVIPELIRRLGLQLRVVGVGPESTQSQPSAHIQNSVSGATGEGDSRVIPPLSQTAQ